jgi:hypothetical protein
MSCSSEFISEEEKMEFPVTMAMQPKSMESTIEINPKIERNFAHLAASVKNGVLPASTCNDKTSGEKFSSIQIILIDSMLDDISSR